MSACSDHTTPSACRAPGNRSHETAGSPVAIRLSTTGSPPSGSPSTSPSTRGGRERRCPEVISVTS
ncbi:hypothetical protein ACFQ0B_69320 [Nonomuraea thailandensis]